MKKVILLVLIAFIFIAPVKADLTDEQADDIAAFATNFIIEGNKRLDKNNLPLLAYYQGQARIDGYHNKLSYVPNNYKGTFAVNAYKWTFDCASFVSYLYNHTFGLNLIRNSSSGEPYLVRDFTADTGHFKTIKSNVLGANIDLNDLKKGDIIIYVGSHVMIYVGDGKIAESTSSCISKGNKNLGFQVVSLASRFGGTKLTVKRVKDGVISKTKKANTKVTWLDTRETVDLVPKKPVVPEPKPKDDDTKKTPPTISYEKPSKEWVKSVKVVFNLKAKNGLSSYSLTTSGDKWTTISGTSYKLTTKFTKNGTYILKVKDKKNLITTEKIVISTIDTEPPLIIKLSAEPHGKYSLITLTAIDSESGLNEKAYSFDNGFTWTLKETYEATESKKYTIKVRDKVGNINSTVISINITEPNPPVINNILFGDSSNNQRKVSISVLNCEDCKINIKNTLTQANDNWLDLTAGTYITYLTEGEYVATIKRSDGKTATRSFKLEIIKTNDVPSNDINSNNEFDSTVIIVIAMIMVGILIISILISGKFRRSNMV